MAASIIVKAKISGGTVKARATGGTVKARAALGQTVVQYVGEANPYTGEYNVTPGDNDQTLRTKGKYMTEDVTVQKIPSNYGKISWNGMVLTVS